MKLAIIGSGPGGYVAAIRAAQLGAEVTVIEKDKIGGTCLNWGCIPTKTLIASAEALSKARRISEFGIALSGEVSPDMPRIIERIDRIVSTQARGINALFKHRNIKFINGIGRLVSPSSIEVICNDGQKETVDADKIIIATGSRPAVLPMLAFDGKGILSSNDAINLKTLPQSLVIIGAGAIGSEFACIFAEFGVQVTIIELLDRPVATEDHEISAILEKEFKKKNIKLVTGVSISKVEKESEGMMLLLNDGLEVRSEKILVSVGRHFNTEDIGLEAVGIDKGKKGEIAVNDRLETNVKGIYAIGDVIGGLLLAHVASKEGMVAAANACGADKKMDYNAVPAAIFTSPEIGSVGLREFQAEEKGLKVKTGHFQFRALAKAHVLGEIAGIIKIVAEAGTDRVLGMHIVGPHASDLVHQGSLAVKAGLTVREVADMIHAHPTLSEGIMEAMADVSGESIYKS